MRNRILLGFLAVMLSLSLVFAACAKPEPKSKPIPVPTPASKPAPAPAPSPKPSPAPAPAPKPFQWPERLTLGTSSVGSGAYMIAGAWTTELEKSTGMTVRVVPEGGTVLRFRWLRNGIIDTYTDSMGTTRHLTCYRAEQRVPDGGPFQPRMIFSAAIQAWGLAVREDSPIKTIRDIGPDTRVAFFPPPSDMTFGMLYWLGLNDGPVLEDPKQGKWNVKLVPFSSPGGFFRSVLDGKADVVFMTATNPSAIEQAGSQYGLRFLEIPYDTEPEGVQKFLDVYAVAGFGPAPEEGVKEIWGVNTLLTYGALYARADMDDDLAYNMAKWIVDNHDLYKDKAPTLPQYNLETFRKALNITFLPVHPGTIRYLKEKGIWTAKDDTRQAYNIRLIDAYIKAWDVARDQASQQEIKVAADSQEFADLWSSVKREMAMPIFRVITDEQVKERMALLDKLGL